MGQFSQGVGRVGKDKIKGLATCFQKFEDISPNEQLIVGAQFRKTLSNESGVVAIGLYAHHLLTSAAGQFQGDASRAGKEVERRFAVEVGVALQHVEDIFFGEICRRACLERAWNVETTAFIAASDNSHDVEIVLSSVDIKRHHVEGNTLDLRDGRTIKLGRRIDDKYILQIFLEFFRQMHLVIEIAHEMHFVILCMVA